MIQGAPNLASSEPARCRERRILHQASPLVAGSDGSCIKRARSLQGMPDLASSERARCRECRILRQASALVAGPQKSCKTTKILCAQCVDAVEPIASAKKVLSTPRVLNDLYSMSRNPTGESST